mgnify:CR=1 FL=1
MKKINAALEYRNTDQISVVKPDDANSVLLKCYDELINSVKSFHDNIVPSTRENAQLFVGVVTNYYGNPPGARTVSYTHLTLPTTPYV